ncbi:MAG TPA: type VI secretion system baseplate subunit TssK [Rhabdochlamydiaceae bacterium]|nr:type VI secretion system baseplate subunit TssK [Rhabdochlamydiaceae bacterium]
MPQLKRVGWQMGQPLLPIHLIAQEDSLLAHLDFCMKNQGLPFYGVGPLDWDDTLLFQGVVSISRLKAIFPSGEIVDLPENGKLSVFDLNKTGKSQVVLYLHLLKEASNQDVQNDDQEEEKIVFFLNQLVLSTDSHLMASKASFKLAEFEKDIEGRWKWNESYSPPLYTISDTPFLLNKLFRLRAILESFQKELEQETSTGKIFEQRTFETKLCLTHVARLRRFLLNVERGLFTHPFYLYEQVSQFLDTLAFMYINTTDINIAPYQHEKLAPLFSKLLEFLLQYLKPSSEKLASLQFEKRDTCYVSERLPRELEEVNEIYFIVQPTDSKVRLKMEGIKLASYSRLENIYRFALSGIPLIRLDVAPFNNNFSRYAAVYRIEKDLEWNFGMTESRIAFSLQEIDEPLQAYLYWR